MMETGGCCIYNLKLSEPNIDALQGWFKDRFHQVSPVFELVKKRITETNIGAFYQNITGYHNPFLLENILKNDITCIYREGIIPIFRLHSSSHFTL